MDAWHFIATKNFGWSAVALRDGLIKFYGRNEGGASYQEEDKLFQNIRKKNRGEEKEDLVLVNFIPKCCLM